MNTRFKVGKSIVRGIGLALVAIVLVASAVQPLGTLAQATEAQIYFDTCPGSGQTTTSILIKDVVDLYSVALKIPFDKNYLEVASIDTSTSIFAPPGTIAPMDVNAFNANGEISFMATLENPQAPFSGAGTLFTVHWNVLVPVPCTDGLDILTIPAHVPVVPPNPPQLSDRNGMDISYTVASPCKSVCGGPVGGGCKITGKVLLQGRTDATGQRPDHSGTDVYLSTDRVCPTNFQFTALWEWPGIVITKTLADGSFSFETDKQCQCLYTARHGYLSGLGDPPYPYTDTVTMTDITLLGGDVTQDDAINIFDLALIANRYGTSDSVADVNGDGKVDIYDLALAAGNSGVARGPLKWPRQ